MTYKKTYVKNPELNELDKVIDQSEVAHTLFMIGDAGTTKFFEDSALYVHVKENLLKQGSTSTLVYLGDNIYPAGLPEDEHEKRAEKEAILDIQLSVSHYVKGTTYFIPGNHDWNNATAGGFDRIRNQEGYVEAFANANIELLPDSGCGVPTFRDVDENLRYIFLDTQWWLHRQKKEKDMPAHCGTYSHENFLKGLENILNDSKDKQKVIFLHHPIYTRGPHKGISSWDAHLFPLRMVSKKLWVPLPGLGTLLTGLRWAGASRQDVSNPRYRKLKKNLLRVTKDEDNLIFASGHDHSLQYFNLHNNHYIISGSGGKTTFARKKGKVEMARSEHGYSNIYFMKNGEAWMDYYIIDKETREGELIYRKKILKN